MEAAPCPSLFVFRSSVSISRAPSSSSAAGTSTVGPFGSPQAQEKYDRAVAEWLANGRQPSAPSANTSPLTVSELILAYWRHVETYYVKSGKPTSEQAAVKYAVRFVRRLYGSMAAKDVSPKALKAVREAMIGHKITRTVKVRDPKTSESREEVKVIQHGLCRRVINKQIGRIKRMFAWAVEEELVPVEVHAALLCVKGLKKGKSHAREKQRVRPVPDAHVNATLPLLPPSVRTMVEVHQLCGGRPQDIVGMRAVDIDMSGPVWEYRPGLKPFWPGLSFTLAFMNRALGAEICRASAARPITGQPAEFIARFSTDYEMSPDTRLTPIQVEGLAKAAQHFGYSYGSLRNLVAAFRHYECADQDLAFSSPPRVASQADRSRG
jgi:hypothetical protein